jgi:hypothetical protein
MPEKSMKIYQNIYQIYQRLGLKKMKKYQTYTKNKQDKYYHNLPNYYKNNIMIKPDKI